jgi:hypothetical protein
VNAAIPGVYPKKIAPPAKSETIDGKFPGRLRHPVAAQLIHEPTLSLMEGGSCLDARLRYR